MVESVLFLSVFPVLTHPLYFGLATWIAAVSQRGIIVLCQRVVEATIGIVLDVVNDPAKLRIGVGFVRICNRERDARIAQKILITTPPLGARESRG
jgi:hypothetical protein